jgi:hypothetical protein
MAQLEFSRVFYAVQQLPKAQGVRFVVFSVKLKLSCLGDEEEKLKEELGLFFGRTSWTKLD